MLFKTYAKEIKFSHMEYHFMIILTLYGFLWLEVNFVGLIILINFYDKRLLSVKVY